jgi:enoyl-CoA hydratase/carnithine racemase
MRADEPDGGARMTRRETRSESDTVVPRRLDDGVAVLTLNRPERHNAINDELAERWGAGLPEVPHGPSPTPAGRRCSRR